MVVLGVPFAWWLLSRFVFPFKLARLDSSAVRAAVGSPGPWSRTEIRLLLLLCGALAGWIGMPWLQRWIPGMSDAHVALLTAVALFLVPSGSENEKHRSQALLIWDDTKLAPLASADLVGRRTGHRRSDQRH